MQESVNRAVPGLVINRKAETLSIPLNNPIVQALMTYCQKVGPEVNLMEIGKVVPE